jgi:5-methylcytosine-specific restriction endonuclease McrA
MAFKRLKALLRGPSMRLSRADAMKIFRRDHFKCQYCGLDGLARFENWLVLTVDHLHPAARGGSRRMDNLVTACQPCNRLKGKHVFASRKEAQEYVLARREEWRRLYTIEHDSLRRHAPAAHSSRTDE